MTKPLARQTVRIGVVGCGFYAANHLHAWSDLRPDGAQLTAVCDIDAAKAEAAGNAFAEPWHTDLGAMIEAHSIDLLDIVTQMDSHRQLAQTAAENGIAAIVQKPFAPTLDDCRAIVACAGLYGTWLAVHENFRFTAGMRRAKQILESGAVGEPNWARINFRTGYDIYRGQPYLAAVERFAIMDNGTHVLDLARFFLGEVERVYCETQTRNPSVKGEDTATMMLRHRSGAVSVVETTYEAHRIPDPFPETLLEIEASQGSVIIVPGEQMRVTAGGKAAVEDLNSPLLSWTSRPWHNSQLAVLHTNAHLLEAFRSGKPAETSGADYLKTCALVEAAYQSAATRNPVRPDEV